MRGRRACGRFRAAACVALAVALVGAPRTGAGQQVRITGTTWIQSIDLRPLRDDSVRVGETVGDGLYRATPGGLLARCVDGDPWCRFRTSGERATTTPLLQDLEVAAWGLGEGISFHAHARARAALGGESTLWPRLGDRFDALDAYLQVERSAGRMRLGRMWANTGLGAYNFDGASLLVRRWNASLEGFGGRALVQGLNEPYTSAEIGVVDDLPPDAGGYLLGIRARARPTPLTAVAATYQRIIRDDRDGLYSERAAVDLSTRVVGTLVDASVTYDVAGAILNEARLRLARPLAGRVEGGAEVRRSRPFFELWTIWGAFAPVGFDEARADLTWRGLDDALQVGAHGAYRQYDDTDAGVGFLPLRSDGWRFGASANWLLSERFTSYGSYDIDVGFGASRSDAAAGMRWAPRVGSYVGANVSGFQTIYEFRVGTGRVLGLALEGATRLTSELRLAADAGVYKHRLTDGAPGTDWSQRRASVRLEWTVGGDPGLVGGRSW